MTSVLVTSVRPLGLPHERQPPELETEGQLCHVWGLGVTLGSEGRVRREVAVVRLAAVTVLTPVLAKLPDEARM